MRRAAFIALILCVSGPVAAHTFPVERSAVLQVHTAHAELLLVYVEPAGPRTERILALYDANGNGEIDGIEQRLARAAFLRRAFAGFNIDYGTQSAPKTAQLRYKRDKDGGLSVAILQRIDLVIDGNTLNLKASVADGAVPMKLIVEPADAWKLGEAEAERLLELSSGKSASVTLQRTATSSDEPAADWKPNLPK